MSVLLPARLQEFPARNAEEVNYAQDFVSALLRAAMESQASDVHLVPSETDLEIMWRVDGVLQPVGKFPLSAAGNILGRLKVLADLLTYYTDRPQEGRLRVPIDGTEMRLSTFPTLFGEKGVIRLFRAAKEQFQRLVDLQFPSEIAATLQQLLMETSGAILITGPAGSGKTTTAYAAMREIAASSAGGRSLVTLEDPIEAVLSGVSQSQINASAGFDFAAGLRSIVRQDPEVILLGEIRDRDTAHIACQAALTGQLLLSTFHTTSAAGAISRLSDMGIEPYVLRSAVRAILAQRLVRRLCECAASTNDESASLGLPVSAVRVPVGCDACRHSGYQGRLVLAELLLPDWAGISEGILQKSDDSQLNAQAVAAGMIPLWKRGVDLVNAGETSPAEVRRVLGWKSFAQNEQPQ